MQRFQQLKPSETVAKQSRKVTFNDFKDLALFREALFWPRETVAKQLSETKRNSRETSMKQGRNNSETKIARGAKQPKQVPKGPVRFALGHIISNDLKGGKPAPRKRTIFRKWRSSALCPAATPPTARPTAAGGFWRRMKVPSSPPPDALPSFRRDGAPLSGTDRSRRARDREHKKLGCTWLDYPDVALDVLVRRGLISNTETDLRRIRAAFSKWIAEVAQREKNATPLRCLHCGRSIVQE